MGVEMLLVPAVVSSREIGRGGTPRVRVDSLTVAPNIARGKRGFSRPEPDLDAVLLATREGVESTSARVEVLTVRTRMANSGSTTLIVVDIGVTVRRGGLAMGTPVSHQHRRVAEEGGGTLTQFGVSPLAWYSREGYATKSSSVRLRERPTGCTVSA